MCAWESVIKTVKKNQKRFTLIELLNVVAAIGIIASAVPGLLRAINSAESTFSSRCGANGYAQTLDDLALPPTGSTAGFISPDLSINGVSKSGFIVHIEADTSAAVVTPASKTGDGSADDAVSAYFAEAHPVTVGSSGQ